VLATITVAALIAGCQKESATNPNAVRPNSESPSNGGNALRDAEERNRLEKERLRIAEEQKRLAEEQLKVSKRSADEQWVQGEVEKKRKELRLLNEKAKEDARRLGIDPSTLPLLDETTVIGQYEKELRRIKGLD
jgi:hypothetical protein